MQGNCSNPRPAASEVYDEYIDIGAIGSNACSILAKDRDTLFYMDINRWYPNVTVCGRVWLSNLVITLDPVETGYSGYSAYVANVELHVVNTVIAGFGGALLSVDGSMYVTGASFHHLILAAYKFPDHLHKSLILFDQEQVTPAQPALPRDQLCGCLHDNDECRLNTSIFVRCIKYC